MKCPECSKNHKYMQGAKGAKFASMRCQCGYRFVINPKLPGNLTDGKLLTFIRKASANNTYYFTFNQLYTVWCQLAYRKSWLRGWIGLIGVVILVILTWASSIGVLFPKHAKVVQEFGPHFFGSLAVLFLFGSISWNISQRKVLP